MQTVARTVAAVRERRGAGAVGVILAAVILMWGTVRIVDQARERSARVDRAYRLIFA